MKRLLIALPFLVGCASSGGSGNVALEQMQIQLADAQRSQHSVETEVEILEARVNKQIQALEEKLARVEKRYERAVGEIEQLSKESAAARQNLAAIEEQNAAMKSALQSVVKLAKETVPTHYTVRSGDTLEKIANRHKTTVAALKRHNGLDKDTIYPGQKLTIPS